MRIVTLTGEEQGKAMDALLRRNPVNYGEYEETVREITDRVRREGDAAVFRYEEQFDRCRLSKETLRVSRREIEEAYAALDPAFIGVMRRAAENIRRYHEKQRQESWISTSEDGVILGQKITPIGVSGCYVPGGRAAYPSSVLMNVIPAKVAGVRRILVCTPPNPEGRVPTGTVVAADIAGADEIYKIGGAQAIAAMAFGTETIPRADKITGPGNIFVALAKKACFGYVGIDSVAGPSEILVIADETANPRYVAADLLSQAEHDPMASAILLTVSRELAEAVSREIDAFLPELDRADIIRESLERYGCLFVGKDMEQLIEAANAIASEHVEIMTAEPFAVMTKLRNAGAIFLGSFSSEPLGDYYAGPNHILPTNGTARFFSPLGVEQFVKRSSIISYSREALERVHEDIELFAENEGLTAHANSIKVRFAEDAADAAEQGGGTCVQRK
ncbi:histidinol dehydrogenase [Lachnoclostridium sp. Marseille-P6806]|uniref:histidinol dehydrogenase n=1 Tax=Lachnoclostridium sp. Marseille-P6806 TaxID=2364793 RepID=UPI001031C0FC|nr:histidinol dehydrogenase [Lachnoclostridium sp. Marseille-P6806]